MDRIQKLKEILYQAFPFEKTPIWDNNGHIITSHAPDCSKILITNDLTPPVIDEAIEKGIKFIISYHPPYYKLPKVLNENTHPTSLVFKMIKHGIDLFVFHTVLDIMKNSINEHLFDFIKDQIEDIQIIDSLDNKGGIGTGRKVTLTTPINLKDMINKLKAHNKLQGLKYALPMPCNKGAEEIQVKTISSLCGCGFDIIEKATGKIDAVITGELQYHQVLELQQNGIAVVLLGHCASERHYLPKLRDKLTDLFKELGNVEVIISEKDKYNMQYLV